jgi:hypothetical protein
MRGLVMNEAWNALYPHVTADEREIVERFEYLFNNTGGNDVLDLLNDFNKPSPNNLMKVNVVRFTLAAMCHAQVGLLRRLLAEGMISK